MCFIRFQGTKRDYVATLWAYRNRFFGMRYFTDFKLKHWDSKSPKCTVVFVSHLHVLTKFGHHQKVHIFKREQLKFSIPLLQVLTASVDQRVVFLSLCIVYCLNIRNISGQMLQNPLQLMCLLSRLKTVNTNSLQKPKIRSQFEFTFKYLKSLMMTELGQNC